MILEEGRIITLKKKDYIIVHIVEYNGSKYMYLISDFKPLENIIVEVQSIENKLVLVEVSNEDTLVEVLKLISKDED